MSYLIDARALQDESRMRGIGTYVRGLLQGYHEMGVDDQLELLFRRQGSPPPELRRYPYKVAKFRLPTTKRRIQPVVDPFTVALALRAEKPTLYHSPDYAQPIVSRCPVVITVHDLIPFVLPDYPWLRRERLLALRQLRHADALLADSQSTANDLVNVAKVRTDRIHVIPLGVRQFERLPDAHAIEASRHSLDLTKPFVLAVGAFDPRKRIGHLLDVYARLAPRGIDLVIIGEQGKFEALIRREVAARSLQDKVHLLGYVSSQDLSALYAGCSCLIFTSAYEGFGLPPLEAMAAGAPVAMFDNSSLREIAGDAAIVARDGDVVDIASRIGAVLDDPADQRARREQGRLWAARFTWRKTAEATFAVYEQVVANRKIGRR